MHTHRFVRQLAAATLITLAASGCARPGAGRGAVPDRSVITRAEIASRHFNNAFDIVEALRSNWLLSRGPDSFQHPTSVQVYLDQMRLGGADQLKTIQTAQIISIRYYDGISATARWGLDHGAGAILVSTQSPR
jgi:hypothetical protein